MEYNYNKLKGRIVEKCGNQETFASMMDLSPRTISLKLNNKIDWRQSEIMKACEVLEITSNQIKVYFFELDVQ